MSMSSGPAAPASGPNAGPGGRSHLVAGTRIVGDITAPGLLEIQGEVEGRVAADSVVIEEHGQVRGEVAAAAVGVRGTFDGHIAAGAVRIHATARLSGTIAYATLSIESGAEVTATLNRTGAATGPAEG